ncbi:hypothetical protein Aperf_G00000012638 [Anoplocephala perfoliata]
MSCQQAFLKFTQDYSALCASWEDGFRIFSTSNGEFMEIIRFYGDAVNNVIRLHNRNLVAVVPIKYPSSVELIDIRRNRLLLDIHYQSSVLYVNMAYNQLIIGLEKTICIYDPKARKTVYAIENVPQNYNGLIALSFDPARRYIAYPESAVSGDVKIFNIDSKKDVRSIRAFNENLVALSFNSSATFLATASEVGTLIRIFSVMDGTRVMEFRHAYTRNAGICSLNFSEDDVFLTCASKRDTVHVFKLSQLKTQHMYRPTAVSKEESSSTWLLASFSQARESVSNAITSVLSMMENAFLGSRAFILGRVPLNEGSSELNKVAAMLRFDNKYMLIVADNGGNIYLFEFDGEKGGEVTPLKMLRIDDAVKDSSFQQILQQDLINLA